MGKRQVPTGSASPAFAESVGVRMTGGESTMVPEQGASETVFSLLDHSFELFKHELPDLLASLRAERDRTHADLVTVDAESAAWAKWVGHPSLTEPTRVEYLRPHAEYWRGKSVELRAVLVKLDERIGALTRFHAALNPPVEEGAEPTVTA